MNILFFFLLCFSFLQSNAIEIQADDQADTILITGSSEKQKDGEHTYGRFFDGNKQKRFEVVAWYHSSPRYLALIIYNSGGHSLETLEISEKEYNTLMAAAANSCIFSAIVPRELQLTKISLHCDPIN